MVVENLFQYGDTVYLLQKLKLYISTEIWKVIISGMIGRKEEILEDKKRVRRGYQEHKSLMPLFFTVCIHSSLRIGFQASVITN